MATTLKTNQWIEILQNRNLTRQINIDIFQAIYSFPKHQAYASQIGQLLNIRFESINLEPWRHGTRIAKVYDVTFSRRSNGRNKYWNFFFKGWYEGNNFAWQLKPEIIEALIETGLINNDNSSGEVVPEIINR